MCFDKVLRILTGPAVGSHPIPTKKFWYVMIYKTQKVSFYNGYKGVNWMTQTN